MTPFFEVLKLAMNCERFGPGSPFLNGGAVRSRSRRCGDSMRITVAPWSASALPIMGPTPTQLKSATFKPANGDAGAGVLAIFGLGRERPAGGAALSAVSRRRDSGVRDSLANGPAKT